MDAHLIWKQKYLEFPIELKTTVATSLSYRFTQKISKKRATTSFRTYEVLDSFKKMDKKENKRKKQLLLYFQGIESTSFCL